MPTKPIIDKINRTARTKAKAISLSSLNLQTVPEELMSLSHLEELYLRSNSIKILPRWLNKLENLKAIYFDNNAIESIPPELLKLKKLETINLSNNCLKEIPSSIGDVTKLLSLDLSGNLIKTLPNELGFLQNLKTLKLSDNPLETLPDQLKNLKKLETFYIRNTRIESLPDWFWIGGPIDLKNLDISQNPIQDPPQEILEKGHQSIIEYFQQREEQGVARLYEAKLLIVGEGGVGKTTLAKKLLNSSYKLKNEEKTTEGIEVSTWSFPIDNNQFQVNIWDFGGQEIYHATHQFFLTRRSLYSFVIDTRKDDSDLYYWLNTVELLSDKSPLLIVLNEKQDREKLIDIRGLKHEFQNIQEVLRTNLATNRGLKTLIKSIEEHFLSLPHIGAKLPKSWTKIRGVLESEKRHYIGVSEYFNICKSYGVNTKKRALQLSEYFHDLGVFLHFQDHPTLKHTIILKPQWGTGAVYKILDNPDIQKKRGRFSLNQLKLIWEEDIYANMHPDLLELMKRFELCYELSDTGEKSFIAPQMLEANLPMYKWDGANNLILKYKYGFLPRGLISRFIVRMHKLIKNQSLVWKSGVIIKYEGAMAEIIEFHQAKCINIRISGQEKKSLMTLIIYQLDELNKSFHKQLDVQKLVPCNCPDCTFESPYLYEYDILKKALSRGNEYIQCHRSFEKANILSLIDDIIDPKIQFKRITDLIAAGNTREALLQLRELQTDDPNLLKEIIFLSKNYEELRRNINAGILTQEQIRTSKNQIDMNLLDFISQIETEQMKMKKVRRKNAEKQKVKNPEISKG